jgi:hypothetical protein
MKDLIIELVLFNSHLSYYCSIQMQLTSFSFILDCAYIAINISLYAVCYRNPHNIRVYHMEVTHHDLFGIVVIIIIAVLFFGLKLRLSLTRVDNTIIFTQKEVEHIICHNFFNWVTQCSCNSKGKRLLQIRQFF